MPDGKCLIHYQEEYQLLVTISTQVVSERLAVLDEWQVNYIASANQNMLGKEILILYMPPTDPERNVNGIV